jgi:hypothetical protein
MTNLELLHQRFDGPIPRDLVLEAIAADMVAAKRRPAFDGAGDAAKVRVKAWKPAGIIDRMADVMRIVARSGFPCLRGHLAQAGFSTEEIDRHSENARALAARRVDDDPSFPREVEIPVAELLARAHAWDIERAQVAA